MTTTGAERPLGEILDDAVELLRQAGKQFGIDDPEYLLHSRLMQGKTFDLICPHWCTGGHPMTLAYGDGELHRAGEVPVGEHCTVEVEAYDDGEHGWPHGGDTPVRLFVGDDTLSTADARALAAALIAAADVYDGKTTRHGRDVGPTADPSCPTWCTEDRAGHDEHCADLAEFGPAPGDVAGTAFGGSLLVGMTRDDDRDRGLHGSTLVNLAIGPSAAIDMDLTTATAVADTILELVRAAS